jgi:hypothetical protein
MERLKQRIETANNALTTFEEVLLIEKPSSIERDATIWVLNLITQMVGKY